jgi:hypothetical protein
MGVGSAIRWYEMDTLQEILSRGAEQLLGRLDGPLHFRLVIMPIVVAILAVRAGLRDAREGQPAFLWAFFSMPAERSRLVRAAFKDIGRIFIGAVIVDTAYQLLVFQWFYPAQVLIVFVTCALAPYVLIRGPVTRFARLLYRTQVGSANRSVATTMPKAEGRKLD